MKPRLLFVYHHHRSGYWMDGLWAALRLLEEKYEITKLNLVDNPKLPTDFDCYLGWGGFNSPVDRFLQNSKQQHDIKMGLCIAGNAYPPTGANKYDVLFYETKWYRPQINFHQNIIQAFGINSDIFYRESISVPAVFDYIGVGSFALWKRWDLMIKKQGLKMVIGEVQEENMVESGKIVGELVAAGVMVSNQIHPFDLANFYHYSRILYMPSTIFGGGERAIWEARACGLNVEIEPDNPKLQELLESDVKDHYWYSQQLHKGIQSIL